MHGQQDDKYTEMHGPQHSNNWPSCVCPHTLFSFPSHNLLQNAVSDQSIYSSFSLQCVGYSSPAGLYAISHTIYPADLCPFFCTAALSTDAARVSSMSEN
jgi:hypothetical protein